ncbi:MAG TPA: SET domain-containing protein-lysine N-methyltransferase [Chitinophagaceae bacterium]
MLKTPEYRLNFELRVDKSRIDGKGAYAMEVIPARKKIGDLGGVIISQREARRIASGSKRVAIVEFGNGKALNAGVNSNALRFINHSCSPNTFMRVLQNRVEFYALRSIGRGEELTCNYGETHHDGMLPCRCGAPGCQGFI